MQVHASAISQPIATFWTVSDSFVIADMNAVGSCGMYMRRVGSRVGSFYMENNAARPIATSMMMGLVSATIGDIACQTLIEEVPWDSRRTAEMGMIRGGLVSDALPLFLLPFFPSS